MASYLNSKPKAIADSWVLISYKVEMAAFKVSSVVSIKASMLFAITLMALVAM